MPAPKGAVRTLFGERLLVCLMHVAGLQKRCVSARREVFRGGHSLFIRDNSHAMECAAVGTKNFHLGVHEPDAAWAHQFGDGAVGVRAALPHHREPGRMPVCPWLGN
ncbi:hypothetical protein [Myxococcus sp. AB056]|uniref:hypothetical protein n=1 Tax=Myxococcus sp. AB056 TaxID=2562792 RepID=UPI0018919235|nr:hypothetical protein [Myxococcus sp. AB056]